MADLSRNETSLPKGCVTRCGDCGIEVFRVDLVYDAKQSVKDESQPNGYRFDSITLVKHVCVEPMPHHSPLDRFLELYEPYDPEAE